MASASCTSRHVQALGPVAALLRRQPPGVALAFVGFEDLLQLVRKLAGNHHLVLAQAEELVQMLQFDGASRSQ